MAQNELWGQSGATTNVYQFVLNGRMKTIR